jgi:TRAP-type C4-dicarboxylate transport system substrate-binding protein
MPGSSQQLDFRLRARFHVWLVKRTKLYQKEDEMKKYSVLVGLVMLSVFLAAAIMPEIGQAAERKTFTLRVAAGHPYAKGCFWIVSAEDFFCREIEKRVLERTKEYEVKCKGFYGGSVAKLGEALEMVQRGIADAAFVATVFEMSKLQPFNFTFWTPFTSTDVDKALRSTIKTVNHFPLFAETLARFNQRLAGDAYLGQTSYQLLSR